MITTWLGGLVRRRSGRLGGAALGVAIAVALLALLGSFLAASKATMTSRATRTIAVDWQVEVQPGADPQAVLATTAAAPGVLRALPVGVAHVPSLSATAGGSTQTTGNGVVLGLPDSYRAAFPGELRTLSGAGSGILLAQQTAANLHAAPGSRVVVQRPGLPPVTETVAGVVDLPQADSLFQKVGAPPQSQPVAPPDNVLLLPAAEFHRLFDPLAAARPDLVTTQVHVARSHALPADPAAAYTAVTGAAHNLEATLTGTGVVGDNLGAALDAARGDALYAQVLFLFLGLPGAVLAGLLTAAVTGAGLTRRRREQALMRTRGGTDRLVLRLAAVEAAIVGIVGGVVGLGAAALIGRLAFGSLRLGGTGAATAWWLGAAFVAGLLVAAGTVLLPVRRDLREATIVGTRTSVRRHGAPRWARYGLDVVLVAVALGVFWASSRSQYTLVLAPEGVPTISVNYWAFLGPACLWLGAGLLTWRLTDLLLDRGRPVVAAALRPVAGPLSGTVAATLSRQRRLVARAVVLLALAVSFAASTATFNSTYQQQAEADARLTNGADVTVTEAPGTHAGPAAGAALASVPGVRRVEPLQHRFAYVGSDLQDLYGVRPQTVAGATSLQDAYFQGGTAAQLMDVLARRPDAILVSAETVKDFQLRPGDLLRLRIGTTTVPFHYAGIAKEFPTAPKDSFFIANSDYVARATHDDSVGAFLVDTGGTNVAAVADRIRQTVGTSATVTDLVTTRAAVGSSLTSVDLAGLTRIELGFALLLAAASGGLVLALGLTERRRMFALAAALGANRRQLGGFVVGEAVVTVGLGLVLGAVSSWALSTMLVKILTGVFDPPPAHLAVPWAYLAAVVAVTVAAIAGVVAAVVRAAHRPAIAVLRES
ncbi:MAG TPA: ABC transporter permease [Mycobacteriales bacterium]